MVVRGGRNRAEAFRPTPDRPSDRVVPLEGRGLRRRGAGAAARAFHVDLGQRAVELGLLEGLGVGERRDGERGEGDCGNDAFHDSFPLVSEVGCDETEYETPESRDKLEIS